MMTDKERRDYDLIVEYGIATAEELNLCFNLVGGSWSKVFENVVYIRTGYNTLEQYIAETFDDFED